MSLLFRLIGMFVGFSLVMLTASLVVMCFARTIQYLANLRGKNLSEMLGSLNQGFRRSHGDVVDPGDAPQTAFVLDVLTHPTLHQPDQVRQIAKRTATRRKDPREALAVRVDYLTRKRLKRIVREWAETSTSPVAPDAAPQLVIPARWCSQLPPEARTLKDFSKYIDTWYSTVEAVGRQNFKLSSKRLATTLSCIVVVALNLDAIRLATDLFNSGPTVDLLTAAAPSLLKTADRMGATQTDALPPTDREALLDGVSETLRQANGILNEPSLELGWTNSWIVKAWCHRSPGSAECRSGSPFPWLDTARWLAGLLLSCVLLSLGAPFWAQRLKDALSFRSALDPGSPAPSASQPSGAGQNVQRGKNDEKRDEKKRGNAG